MIISVVIVFAAAAFKELNNTNVNGEIVSLIPKHEIKTYTNFPFHLNAASKAEKRIINEIV